MTITRRRTLGLLAGAALVARARPRAGLSHPRHQDRRALPGRRADRCARPHRHARSSAALGQNAIVENVGGGAGAIGTRQVAKAEPDGHTLVLSTNQTHATNNILLKDPGYDARRTSPPSPGSPTFSTCSWSGTTCPCAPSPSSSPTPRPIRASSITARPASARPRTSRWSCSRPRPGTDLVHVPFRGAAPMAQELVAGRIDAAFATLPSRARPVPGRHHAGARGRKRHPGAAAA